MMKLTTKEQTWLTSVERYIDNVFTHASSTVEPNLLADGFDKQTYESVYWLYEGGRKAPISNFASQQHFLRLLVATSLVTENNQYQQKAQQIVNHFVNNFTDKVSHLLYWGGHRFINHETLQTEGPANKEQVHELKNHLPYYDLLFHTNNSATLNYIKSLWTAHVSDWDKLDFSRHGDYNKPLDPNVFAHARPDVVDPSQWPHLPKTIGLTFINAGTDLIYAAYKYAAYTGDTDAQAWAKHLYKQYILARCPQTGMPVYQFSSPLQREPIPADDNRTESWFGDRAQRQFGPEFGEIAIEANVLFRDMTPMDMWPMLMDNPVAILSCMKKNPDPEVIGWVVSGLTSYYRHAYDATTNTLRPLWGNGIDMTGYVFKRDGYYGKKGTLLTPLPLKPDYLLPLIQAWLLSKDNELETIIIAILHSSAIAEFGDSLIDLKTVNDNCNIAAPNLLFALIELNIALQQPQLDSLITIIADNLYRSHFDGENFIESTKHRFVRIDNIYPIALLAVIAYKQGQYAAVPIPLSKGGYIHGEYLVQGEVQTVYDVNYIYQQLV